MFLVRRILRRLRVLLVGAVMPREKDNDNESTYGGHRWNRDLGHLHDHLKDQQEILRRFGDRLQRLEESERKSRASLERVETSTGASQGGIEEILKRMADQTQQLQDIAAKFDAFTNGYAAVIDSAVARILEEIAKDGEVTAAEQAAADHLSMIADNLQAANLANLDRIAAAGAPVVVPPSPEPVPEPVPPIEPAPDDGGGGGTEPTPTPTPEPGPPPVEPEPPVMGGGGRRR